MGDDDDGWGEVPDDLIYLLAKRLVGLGNIIRFGVVCRSWHALVSDKDQIMELGHKEVVPWLLLPESDQSEDGNREFFDLSTGEVYTLSLPLLRGRRCVGSSHGWLITTGLDLQFHLLNPFTGVQISLPSYSTFQSFNKFSRWYYDEHTPQQIRDTFMKKAILSSDPLAGDYVVMATHLGFNQTCISFTGSHDKEWTNFEPHVDEEIALIRGKFYSVSGLGKIHLCDIDNGEPKLKEIACLPKSVCVYNNSYLVDCNGEILVVLRYISHDDDDDDDDDESDLLKDLFWTSLCRVFKLLDWEGPSLPTKSGEVSDGWGVVEITSIGDHALFLGKNNSVSLPTRSDVEPLRRNCIYFTEDYLEGIMCGVSSDGIYKGGIDSVVFNLDDKRFKAYYPGVLKASFCPPVWVTSNPW